MPERFTHGDEFGYLFCAIEGIGSHCVYTDNVVDGGAKIGLSVSSTCKKDYAFWARNTVRACNQWGAQFQGEANGLAYHYLYRCRFVEMPVGVGPVWYPGDEAYGFRSNGNARCMTFEECEFSDNGRLGIQLIGAGMDFLSFVRCTIKNNKGAAVSGPQDYSAHTYANAGTYRVTLLVWDAGGRGSRAEREVAVLP